MTVSTKNISQTFQGNDIATEFGFQFPFFTKDEIDVYLIDKDSKETKLVFGTDYDIPGRRFPRGATVKLLKGPLASTDKLFVIRVIDYTQLTAFRNMGAYKAEAHENALDKLTMLVQQNLFNDSNNLKLNFAGDEWQTRGIPFDSIKSNSSIEGKSGSFDSLSVSDSASIKSLSSDSASIKSLSSDLNASWNRITKLPPPSDDEEPMRRGDAINAGAGPTFKYVDDKAAQLSNAGDSQLSGGKIWPVENTLIPLGAQSTNVPSGISRLKVETGVQGGELLYLWEPSGNFSSSARTVTSVSLNIYRGYEVVTTSGTFEFLPKVIKSKRLDKQLSGWSTMVNLSDITLQMEAALSYNPRLKIETDDGLERELKISFNHTYTPVSGNQYKYGVELPSDTDITRQANILISTDAVSGIMFPIAVGASYVRPRMKLKGNGSSLSDIDSLLFGIATHIDASFVMKMYSNIYVDYCEFVSGFNIDTDLRNVSGWKLRSNIHRGALFSRTHGAVAGYQQHVASCDDGERAGNRHYSGGFDRHAFYLATAQSGKNNHCHSHHNFYKWGNTDHTYSPYMSAINCRPTHSLSIDHEIIDGAWGSGISFTTDSGNTFTNLAVDHNEITNIGVKQPENAQVIPGLYGAGISARISVSGNYAFGSIDNNVIILRQSPDNTLCLGIVLNGIDLASNDNVIKLAGDNQYGVGFQLACDGITSHDEKITGNGFDNQSPYLLMGATSLNNCLIGPHKTKGFKVENPIIATNGAFTVPNGTIIDFTLSFIITTDGSGNVIHTDNSGSISSVTLTAEGVIVSFNSMAKPDELSIRATAMSPSIGNIFVLKSPSTVQFVPRDYSGAAINPGSVALSMDVALTRKGS